MAEQFIGVGLDFLALQRIDRGDDELDAGLLLEIGELLLEALPGVGRQQAGLIDDAAGQVRKRERLRKDCGGNERERQPQERRQP